MSPDDAMAALAVLGGGTLVDLAGVILLPGAIDLGDGDLADARVLTVVAADVISARLLATDLNLRRGPGGTTWTGLVHGPRGSSIPIQCRVTVQTPPELAAILGAAPGRQGDR
ncbi:hypothetical protein ACFT2C_04345 [Promicromonospora sp. NPDC057138]|uniref:hypothetical protein n=1 Tax=Promicromonospora sp. NPDC057138 TaxID=3346031 RepID=UPI00363EA793